MNGQDKLVKAAKRCWNSCVCKSVYVWDMYLFTFLFYINSEVHPEVQQLFFSYTFLSERLPHSWAQVFGFAFLKSSALVLWWGFFFFYTEPHAQFILKNVCQVTPRVGCERRSMSMFWHINCARRTETLGNKEVLKKFFRKIYGRELRVSEPEGSTQNLKL